jgi:hypothetical protein
MFTLLVWSLNLFCFNSWAARVLVNSAEACRHGRKVPLDLIHDFFIAVKGNSSLLQLS